MTRRSNIDATRLASLASRPGIDPRLWVVYAKVEDVGFDPDHGIFADVSILPDGLKETVYLGAPYAGSLCGAYFPVLVGDVVIVAIPIGDANTGAVIVARGWSSASKPSTDFRDATDTETATQDAILRMRAGQSYKVHTSGAGEVSIAVEGASAHLRATAGGQVRLQDASQPFVRGTTYADALGVFLDAIKVVMTAVGVFATAVGVAVPAVAAAAVTLNAAIVVMNTAADTFKASRTVYLSTKVMGQ